MMGVARVQMVGQRYSPSLPLSEELVVDSATDPYPHDFVPMRVHYQDLFRDAARDLRVHPVSRRYALSQMMAAG